MGRFPLIRRRLRACLLLLLFVVFSVSPLEAAARKRKSHPAPKRREAPAPQPSSLGDALALASQRPPSGPKNLSIEIVELDSGEPVFQKNSESPETIASVTKLFSTATALHFLGPDYKFKTTFWRTGEVRDGVLEGSLLVVGGGDPNISGRFYNDDYNAVFDKWASGLKALGVTKVTGQLILNDSFFDTVTRHPDWQAGQEQKWYQAPVSALAYNDNVVLVGIRPGPRPGNPAAISFEPSTGSLRALSNAKTVGQRGKIAVGVRRVAGSNAVSVSGTVPLRGVWWSTPIAVDDPVTFFGGALKNRLKAAGIEVAGGVTQKDLKPDDTWAIVAQTESALVPTLAVINKRSQGFYAEQTFKTVAAEKMGKGTWANALSLEKQFLASLNLDPERFDLHDGSGLSPNNRVAAGDIVRFLRAMNTSPNGAIFKTTMATGGEPEGTLRHRLNDPISRGRVLAKTGSIHGVSTLAGYATGVSGKTYAFAILLNGGRVYDANGHAYQDRLVRALIKNG